MKRRDKWCLLRLGAHWDQSTVFIYEAAARGRCVPLLKTLLTTHCTNECKYCAFRGLEMSKNEVGAREIGEGDYAPLDGEKNNHCPKDTRIRYSSGIEQIIGADLTRRVNQYVDLQVSDLPIPLKVNKGIR